MHAVRIPIACTRESRDYAPPPFVHASIGQKWEGGLYYTRDKTSTIYTVQELELKVQGGLCARVIY